MKFELKITRKVLFEKFDIKHGMEYFLLSLLGGCDIDSRENDKSTICFVKEWKNLTNVRLFMLDKETKRFFVSYTFVYYPFMKKYSNFENDEICKDCSEFIKNIFSKHLYIPEYNVAIMGG